MDPTFKYANQNELQALGFVIDHERSAGYLARYKTDLKYPNDCHTIEVLYNTRTDYLVSVALWKWEVYVDRPATGKQVGEFVVETASDIGRLIAMLGGSDDKFMRDEAPVTRPALLRLGFITPMLERPKRMTWSFASGKLACSPPAAIEVILEYDHGKHYFGLVSLQSNHGQFSTSVPNVETVGDLRRLMAFFQPKATT